MLKQREEKRIEREQAANLVVQKEQEEQAVQSFTPYWNFPMIDDVEELSDYTNSPSWNRHIFYDDDEHSIQYRLYLENSSKAITPVLPTEEPEYSLSMGDEHLSTAPEMKSDEIIKSSVENLVPIPSEYEGILDDTCDVPICEDYSTLKDHSKILSDSNDDDTSSNDDAFEDIEYVEASLLDSELVSLEEVNDVDQEEKEIDLEEILQIQDVLLREKLLNINSLIANIESLNDNPTPDRVLKSPSLFHILVEDKETNSGSTITHVNNSLPEYDSFCFEIEPDQGRLTSVVMDNISDDSTNDPLLEAVDLFFASNNSIPLGIENIDYDSKGDIHFLKELLSNDSLPLLKNESSNFDHHDDPSFPRPPSEPPDVEVFFDFELDSRELISAVMNNIDELNEDECFDPGGGEIDVFINVEDDDYFPFIFVIRIFLPYLTYPEVSPLLLSTGSEDTILTLASPLRADGILLGWNFHVL
nr:hypothetical protein [Tanacetum cinerariifolium]GEY07995.1 hypothetical protein [Tanacetum cinerariifolium]